MDDQCAKLLGKENFVQILIDLLKAKQEDDEMVCQVKREQVADLIFPKLGCIILDSAFMRERRKSINCRR